MEIQFNHMIDAPKIYPRCDLKKSDPGLFESVFII